MHWSRSDLTKRSYSLLCMIVLLVLRAPLRAEGAGVRICGIIRGHHTFFCLTVAAAGVVAPENSVRQ